MKYLKLLRIKHYLKNTLLFIPLFTSINLFDVQLLTESIKGFFALCLTTSIVYIINDIKDVEYDKMHPIKCKRVLASGEITKKSAKNIAFLLSVLLLGLSLMINYKYALIYLVVYLGINVLYSYILKEQPILEVFIIAFGFILRVLFGSAVINVETSSWLYLTIMSFSLFMAFGKRRNELFEQNNEFTDNTRKVLQSYTYQFLDKIMYVVLTMGFVFYSLWCAMFNSSYLLMSILFVLYIAFKYLLNIEDTNSSGDPVDIIYNDKNILYIGIIFVIYMTFSIYVL
ncbi:MAG: UbiA prenyltransferase family protein [Bacilli bacterium]